MLARPLGVNPVNTSPISSVAPDPGQMVTVPYGYFNSDISPVEPNRLAEELANSLLECCFINKEIA
jgi:hypothetical protein